MSILAPENDQRLTGVVRMLRQALSTDIISDRRWLVRGLRSFPASSSNFPQGPCPEVRRSRMLELQSLYASGLSAKGSTTLAILFRTIQRVAAVRCLRDSWMRPRVAVVDGCFRRRMVSLVHGALRRRVVAKSQRCWLRWWALLVQVRVCLGGAVEHGEAALQHNPLELPVIEHWNDVRLVVESLVNRAGHG